MKTGRALVMGSLLVAACAHRSPAESPSPPPRAPAVAPAPPKAPQPEVSQRFVEHYGPTEEFADPDRRKKVLASLPEVEKYLGQKQIDDEIPGLAVGIVLDDELVFAKGFGAQDLEAKKPVTRDTVFRIGSITKTFTGMAVLKLRDSGLVDLDVPAAKYLPELGRVVYPTRDAPPITLRALVTHTSGLPRLGNFDYTDPNAEPTEAKVLAALDGLVLESPPGTRGVYSNFGASLVGLLVGRVAKTRYRDFVAREILTPLGMTATVWDEAAVPKEHMATAYALEKGEPKPVRHWRLGASEGAGGLYSSVRDMARYAAAHLAAYPPRGEPETLPLRRSSIRESHSVGWFEGLSASDEDDGLDATARGTGVYWGVRQDCEFDHLVHHGGGTEGFRTSLQLLPRRGAAVIVLANIRADVGAIGREVLLLLKESGGLAPRRPVPNRLLEAKARAFVSLYRTWSKPAYAELFSEGFRRHVDAPTMQGILTTFRERHGDCAFQEPARARGRFRLSCTRGTVSVRSTLDAASGRFVGFWLRSKGLEPPPELVDSAKAIAKLVGAWSTRSCQKTLASGFDCEKERATFRVLKKKYGRCRVGKKPDSDGQRELTVPLECKKGSPVLELERAREDKKIVRFTVREVRASRGRCR